MTEHVVVRAPGKLFVLGEYAVLHGCPAIVAAIDRYVEVRARRREDSRVRFNAPGLSARLEFDAGRPPTSAPLRFALAAYERVTVRHGNLRSTGCDVDILSNLDPETGVKTGLGGSAAISVAVTGALLALGGNDVASSSTRDEIFRSAFEAHREAQGGSGSGADVAASCYGGLVRVEPRTDGVPQVSRVPLLAEVALLVGWTGQAASTPSLVERYRSASNGKAAARADFVCRTRACVDAFLSGAWRNSLDTAGHLLDDLARALALPLMTPRLQQLVEIARFHGAGAKHSGAGGGDCGIALVAQRCAADRIRAAWLDAGITPLNLQLDQQGVHRVPR
ncbi:MAG TPA: hypothetical protein VMW17_24560 [Candidatus Binatia bacterium]|nr:hypothetical protein [Candidatus Binatia bacterium]